VFESKKELIQHLLLGNKAKHVEADVIIEIDDEGDLVFTGKSETNQIVDANDYKQWLKTE
jgi:hypothetical protein